MAFRRKLEFIDFPLQTFHSQRKQANLIMQKIEIW